MTSRRAKQKQKKKQARIARGTALAFGRPTTTPSNYEEGEKEEPALKNRVLFPITTKELNGGTPSPDSLFKIQRGTAPQYTHVFLQRYPWFVDLPIDDLEVGKRFKIPLDMFRSDPVVADSRSYDHKTMDRLRGNLRQYFECMYPDICKELATKHLTATAELEVFRRLEKRASPTTPDTLARPTRDGTSLLHSKRPSLSRDNVRRVEATLVDNPNMSLSSVVNAILNDWYGEE